MRLLLLVFLFLAGCRNGLYVPKSPTSTVTTTDGTVITTTGDTPTPPKSEITKTKTTLPLALGQALVFDSRNGKLELTLSRDVTLTNEVTQTKIEGPTSFKPPAPPTISDVKKEERKTYLYVVLFLGVAAAIFGLVRDWHVLMVGGACVAGAAYLGIFVTDHPVITILVCAAGGFMVAGPYVYHLLKLQTAPKS